MEIPTLIRIDGPEVAAPPSVDAPGPFLISAAPTAGKAFEGHAGEVAFGLGDGRYEFVSKARLKTSHVILQGGVIYTHTGSVLQAVPVGTTAAGTALVQAASVAAQITALLGDPPTDGNPYLLAFTNDGIAPTTLGYVAAADYENP